MNFFTLRPVILTLFISLTSLCFSQYKYDLGVKAGTFEREALQLEQRFHLKSPYMISATLSLGGASNGYGFNGQLNADTLVDQTNFIETGDFYGLKLGVARKLSIMNNSFFYVGGSILGGYEQFQMDSSHLLIYVDPNGESIHFETGESVSVVSDQKRSFSSGAYFQLAVMFGMDIPISKRFSINCELNGLLVQSSLGHSNSLGLRFVPSFSGGLRYSFGN